jgi:uncharacterized membrane protein YjdF
MDEVVVASAAKHNFRRYEFLAFSIAAFVCKSALLVRLPYRLPAENALYTTLLLLAFYLYFRFRYKVTPPLVVVIFLGAAVGIDVFGNAFQLYGRKLGPLEYDEFTHFVGSGLSLVPAMWLLRATTRKFGVMLPLDLLAFLSTSIAFSFCAYYEILELWDERYWGDFQRLWSAQDSANDLQWDLSGIVIAALLTALVFKLSDRRESRMVKTAGSDV